MSNVIILRSHSGGVRPRFCAIRGLALATVLSFALPARAEKLVVVEARGVAQTAGEAIDSSTHLDLRLGERLTLIGENGNQYCLDGPYAGPAMPPGERSRESGWSGGLFSGLGREAVDPLTDCLK